MVIFHGYVKKTEGRCEKNMVSRKMIYGFMVGFPPKIFESSQFLNHDGSRYTTVTAWMETIEVRGIFQDMDRNSDRF